MSREPGRPGGLLRELWADGNFVLAPLVYDGLSARVATIIGFEALYLSGFATAATLGLPDVGLTTQTEMVENVRRVCGVTSLPVIADADTGYGNAINVIRTVREYERAGAAGLHIEDQTFPKKCGFLAGKQVIPAREHSDKIKAACDARVNDDFVVIARTDALTVNGWDDVVERVTEYRSAGADLVFVDGISTHRDALEYAGRIVEAGIPALFNGSAITAGEAKSLGFRLHICGGAHRIAYYTAHLGYRELMSTGKVSEAGSLRSLLSVSESPPPLEEILDDG